MVEFWFPPVFTKRGSLIFLQGNEDRNAAASFSCQAEYKMCVWFFIAITESKAVRRTGEEDFSLT